MDERGTQRRGTAFGTRRTPLGSQTLVHLDGRLSWVSSRRVHDDGVVEDQGGDRADRPTDG